MTIQIRSTSGRGYVIYKNGEPVNPRAPIKSIKVACLKAKDLGASGGWTKERVDEGFGARTIWTATAVEEVASGQ